MKDIRINVQLASVGHCEVALQLDDSITCGETVQLLLDSLALQPREKKRRWRLVERWKGCERTIASEEQLVPLYAAADREEVKVCLKRMPLPSKTLDKRRHTRIIKHDLKQGSGSSMFTGRLTQRKLHCLSQLMKKELRKRRKKYRDILFKRLAAREPLWSSGEMTQLDLLRIELGGLCNHNLKLASQVADLNITSTDLRSKLNLLRQKSLTLSDELSKLEEKVRTKKEERERQGPKNMAQVQTEIIKLRRELEVRNRLNASQNAKLKAQKDLLNEKQQQLAEKKKELELTKLKKHKDTSCDGHVTYKSPERQLTSPAREFCIRQTPSSASARRDHILSSASKKRHSSIFEVKTRQLVEEESKAFRQLQAKKLDFDEVETTHQEAAAAGYRSGPEVRTEGRDEKGNSPPSRVAYDESRATILKKTRARSRSTKHVRFTPDCLILNTASEGDLDLLKECTRKLGSCLQSSDKGATCLHNAVCSGKVDIASYLVEQGCNVNAQDIDGWTPLHVAVAYRNFEMLKFLVHQGASLFVATHDGDTPLKILVEDHKMISKEEKDSEKTSQLEACLQYLTDLQQDLGTKNNGVVYTLFSRQGKDSDELSFVEGEELHVLDRGDEGEGWWSVENINKKQGLVPSTYLGPYRPQNLGTLL